MTRHHVFGAITGMFCLFILRDSRANCCRSIRVSLMLWGIGHFIQHRQWWTFIQMVILWCSFYYWFPGISLYKRLCTFNTGFFFGIPFKMTGPQSEQKFSALSFINCMKYYTIRTALIWIFKCVTNMFIDLTMSTRLAILWRRVKMATAHVNSRDLLCFELSISLYFNTSKAN